MATGRQGRAERLNERLRGAQRANVADDSFSFDVSLAPPSSSKPNKSPYGLPNTSKESLAQVVVPPSQKRREEVAESSPARPGSGKRRRIQEPVSEQQAERLSAASARLRRLAEADDESASNVSSPAERRGRRSSAKRASDEKRMSPVRESPMESEDELSPDRPRAKSPEIGSVRRARVSSPVQPVVAEEPRTSSSNRPRRLRSSSSMPEPEVEDPAPEPTPVAEPAKAKRGRKPKAKPTEEAEPEEESPVETTKSLSRKRTRQQVEVEETPEAEEPEKETEQPEAEEINAAEAAKALRKRPRRSPRRSSPELGSGGLQESIPSRRKAARSPAKQKHPLPKTKIKTRKPKAKTQDSGNSIDITVQRLVNLPDTGTDALALPFSNRNAETAVDVLAQVSDEVMGHVLEGLHASLSRATDSAEKKIARVKMRAVEAFREEVNLRYLQHAIHLNHWHALRKRVRHVQKQKLTLREEILALKKEREQVALQMDAVRGKHEADTKEMTFRLDTSALMHDIDLAVETGQDAPALAGKAAKQAELANLEVNIARVAGQVAPGGLLSEVREFNRMLERAAQALEAR